MDEKSFPGLIPGFMRRFFNLLTMGRSPLSAIFLAVTSLLCGFLHALPLIGHLPSSAALASAARGLDPNPPAGISLWRGWCDALNGWLWESGGASRLALGQWLAVFLTWTLLAGFVFLGLWLFLRMIRPRTSRVLPVSVALLVLLTGLPAFLSSLQNRDSRLTSMELIAPVDLMATVQDLDPETIFANDQARAALRLFAPAMASRVQPTDPKLTTDPKAWRRALRENKWQVALLTGPMTFYRPLLTHLLTSPDWQVVQVTNQGHLFRRGAGTPLPTPEIDAFSLSTERETALYLAQWATRLDAIHQLSAAKAAMDRALALQPDDVEVQSYAATLAATHKKWHEAATHATAALEIDPTAVQPRLVRTLAEFETGELNGASDDLAEVLRQNPDDPYSLFLLARISRAKNDTTTEIQTLEHLIALTARTGQPVIHYQIYLAQAYAKAGKNEEARKTYHVVLDQGQLNPEQTTAIEEAITAIDAARPGKK